MIDNSVSWAYFVGNLVPERWNVFLFVHAIFFIPHLICLSIWFRWAGDDFKRRIDFCWWDKINDFSTPICNLRDIKWRHISIALTLQLIFCNEDSFAFDTPYCVLVHLLGKFQSQIVLGLEVKRKCSNIGFFSTFLDNFWLSRYPRLMKLVQ